MMYFRCFLFWGWLVVGVAPCLRQDPQWARCAVETRLNLGSTYGRTEIVCFWFTNSDASTVISLYTYLWEWKEGKRTRKPEKTQTPTHQHIDMNNRIKLKGKKQIHSYRIRTILPIPPFVRSNTACCYGDHAAESTSDKVQNFSPALFLCNFLSPCKESVSKIGQKIARLRVQSDLCHSFLMLLPCATSWQGTHFVIATRDGHMIKIKTVRAQVADRQTLRHKVPARWVCTLHQNWNWPRWHFYLPPCYRSTRKPVLQSCLFESTKQIKWQPWLRRATLWADEQGLLTWVHTAPQCSMIYLLKATVQWGAP